MDALVITVLAAPPNGQGKAKERVPTVVHRDDFQTVCISVREPVGAQLRYFVQSGKGQILACLLWTSPAWKIAARDQWIGWNRQQRARNLAIHHQ